LDRTLKADSMKTDPALTIHRTTTSPIDYSIVYAAHKALTTNPHPWVKQMTDQWQNVRFLLAKLKQQPVRTTEGSKTYIVSCVSNRELQAQVRALDDLVQHFPTTVEQNTSFQGKVIKAALAALTATQHELLNYGEIINNASFVENMTGGSQSEPVRHRCVNAPAAVVTAQWLNYQVQGCQN
jgi:hypothetical protein